MRSGAGVEVSALSRIFQGGRDDSAETADFASNSTHFWPKTAVPYPPPRLIKRDRTQRQTPENSACSIMIRARKLESLAMIALGD